jgi:hypothetical protein
MGILRQLFGPSQKEIWRQLADEIHADYIKGNKVEAHCGQWTVTLDIYTVSHGKSATTYTRLRAPYVNKDGFRFTIYRKGPFTRLGKLLGMQDVEVGFPEFDKAFVIKGNNEEKLRALFADSRIRQLIEMQQKKIQLTVKDNEGWFGKHFPDGVDELYFMVPGVIKDIDRLKSLYYLFAETLNRLCQIGSADESDPEVKL